MFDNEPVTTMTTLRRTEPSELAFARPGLHVCAERGLAFGKIRIIDRDPPAAFRRIVGVEPPATGTQVERHGLQFAWLSPNEWLVTGSDRDLREKLAQVGESDHVLAIDLTHGRVSFDVWGTDARDALASLCPLDLWSEVFPVDAVARSLLGEAGMFIVRLPDLDGAGRFRVVVDQTMAPYVERLFTESEISMPAQS